MISKGSYIIVSFQSNKLSYIFKYFFFWKKYLLFWHTRDRTHVYFSNISSRTKTWCIDGTCQRAKACHSSIISSRGMFLRVKDITHTRRGRFFHFASRLSLSSSSRWVYMYKTCAARGEKIGLSCLFRIVWCASVDETLYSPRHLSLSTRARNRHDNGKRIQKSDTHGGKLDERALPHDDVATSTRLSRQRQYAHQHRRPLYIIFFFSLYIYTYI